MAAQPFTSSPSGSRFDVLVLGRADRKATPPSIACRAVVRYLKEGQPYPTGSGHMARQKQSTEPTEDQLKVNTARLQTLAKAAADIAQAKQWRARKSGFLDRGEASEVRNLSADVEARAQAEAAMHRMMAKPGGKRRSR